MKITIAKTKRRHHEARASPVFVVAFERDILQCGDGVNNQRAMSSVGVPTDRSLAKHTHTHRQKEGDKVRDREVEIFPRRVWVDVLARIAGQLRKRKKQGTKGKKTIKK